MVNYESNVVVNAVTEIKIDFDKVTKIYIKHNCVREVDYGISYVDCAIGDKEKNKCYCFYFN